MDAHHYNAQALKQAFMAADINKDGKLSLGEFTALLHKGDPNMHKKDIHFLFRAVKGNDDVVSFNEFVNYLFDHRPSWLSTKEVVSLKDLKRHFKQLDGNNSGKISVDELYKYVNVCQVELNKLVDAVDKDQDRMLNFDEFVQLVYFESHKYSVNQAVSSQSAKNIKQALDNAKAGGVEGAWIYDAELAMHKMNIDMQNVKASQKEIQAAEEFMHAELEKAWSGKNKEPERAMFSELVKLADKKMYRFREEQFVSKVTLKHPLENGDTALLKGEWLQFTANSTRFKMLPRRQELPEDAFVAIDEGFDDRFEMYKIAAVSYCWLTPDHPDPKGQQLKTLATALRSVLLKYESLLCFFDWGSLFQKERTEEQYEAFKRSLSHMEIWYVHQETLVLRMTQQPKEWKTLPYEDRGWPVFEFAVSCMISLDDQVLDLGLLKEHDGKGPPSKWAMFSHKLKSGRNPPMSPEVFMELLRTKTFTNGSDFDIVESLYRHTFEAVMRGVRELKFDRCSWGDSEAEVLAGALSYCKCLESLNVAQNAIGCDGAKALATTLLEVPSIREIDIQHNNIGENGAKYFVDLANKITEFEKLCWFGNPGGKRLLREAWIHAPGRRSRDALWV